MIYSMRTENGKGFGMVTKNRRTDLDLMKIIACVCVVFIHTGKYGHFHFTVFPFKSLQHHLYFYPAFFSKMAVPLFLAVSGALLLGREGDTRYHYKKRVSRSILLLIFGSAVYYVSERFLLGREWLPEDLFYTVMGPGIKYHLWFLYLYVCFQISVPLLQAMVQNLSDSGFLILFFFGQLERSRNLIEFLLTGRMDIVNAYIRPSWMASSVVLFPCLGYYLDRRVKEKELGKLALGLWCATIIAMECCYRGTLLDMARLQQFGEEYPGTFLESFDGLFAATVFITVKMICVKWKAMGSVKDGISALGSATLGVYLFHAVFNNMPWTYGTYEKLRLMGIPHEIALSCYMLLLIVPSLLVTWILHYVPGINRLIGVEKRSVQRGNI